jgi:hypothetical protein
MDSPSLFPGPNPAPTLNLGRNAKASNTNNGLLAVVDELVLLEENDPFPLPTASSACHLLDKALVLPPSRTRDGVPTRHSVSTWNASWLRGAIDKLLMASNDHLAAGLP